MTNVEVIIGARTFTFHEVLKNNLDIYKRHNLKDWDFKYIVSGDGMTRTGKTTIAAQIAIYLDPNSTENNWIYEGSLLRKKGLELGQGAVIIYDEAREGLDSRKGIQSYSQNIIDYLNECGYLNQHLIIILPDFFDLNKTVALNLSMCLINVYAENEFARGKFDFYNRVDKKYLYIKGKQFHDYSVQHPSFKGNFSSYFPFDYKKLEKLKEEHIKRKDTVGGEKLTKLERRYKRRFEAAVKYLFIIERWKHERIAQLFSSDNEKLTKDIIAQITMEYKN